MRHWCLLMAVTSESWWERQFWLDAWGRELAKELATQPLRITGA